MSQRIAEHDWADTPLGPADLWPQSLRTAVRIVLGSRFAMWMAWGPELTFFYNDKYAADTLAIKHPWALGRRADEVWAEIWEDIGPRIETGHLDRHGDLGRGPAAVPGAQRLPRGDLPHVLLQPAVGRGREHGGDAVRGGRGDRAGDRRAAPGDAARAGRRRRRGDHRARPVRRRRRQPVDQPLRPPVRVRLHDRRGRPARGGLRGRPGLGRRRACSRRRPPSSSWRVAAGSPRAAGRTRRARRSRWS